MIPIAPEMGDNEDQGGSEDIEPVIDWEHIFDVIIAAYTAPETLVKVVYAVMSGEDDTNAPQPQPSHTLTRTLRTAPRTMPTRTRMGTTTTSGRPRSASRPMTMSQKQSHRTTTLARVATPPRKRTMTTRAAMTSGTTRTTTTIWR